jgi:two-component system, NtrC family, response regulator HydG
LSRPMRILIGTRAPMLEWFGPAAAALPVELSQARTGAGVEELARRMHPDVVLTDLVLPDTTAAELLPRLKEHSPFARVIVMAARPTVTQAVELMRAGAFNVLEQPVERDTLLSALTNARTESRRHRERRERTPSGDAIPAAIVGRGRSLCVALDTLRSVAPSEANCLILGENGTGKELVANAIHAMSGRANGPLIKINCAAIAAELFESELFGHKKGAFTDAMADRQGLFEHANGGSLFLDEIGELPSSLQVKLLRVLQEREFRPVGGDQSIALDARLICATNVDVPKAVRDGRLREDLLFRINTITLKVPPLRDRIEDLAVLCAHFLAKFSDRYDRRLDGVSAAALETMARYHWPGNVRELESVIERAVLLTPKGEIGVGALAAEVRRPVRQQPETLPELMTLVQVERRAVTQALEQSGWNIPLAAKALGIYPATLYSKMRRYGISSPWTRHGAARR